MKTITIHRRLHDCPTSTDPRMTKITLPLVPGVDVTEDRSETAPRSVAVRGKGNWKRDKMLAMAARVKA
ncbi:MAG: hypothetical protein MUD11_16985 [Rhodobacteraceae bacterium]|jgi:hypothetical protein|nr:hypothetical protein [Paracoccaceae bacterium]